MDNIHFISGLPRSGSTLFSAILKQNPRFHAAMTSPLASLTIGLQRQMSQEAETSVFINNDHRTEILKSVFDAYYKGTHEDKVIFDTNRTWCAKLPLLKELFPRSKVIACVRHIPWIVDSIEQLVRKNPLEPSKIFGFDSGGNVYSRFEALASSAGMVGAPFHALKEAFFSGSDQLMLLTYDTLTKNPKRALKEVYDFIAEPYFEHDFSNVEYEANEFDFRLGTPDLHKVSGPVKNITRKTVLPPDLFERMQGDSFWIEPANNVHKVKIV